MKVIGKVISFYKKAGTSEVNVYTSLNSNRSYRMAVVQVEGLASPVQVRAYSDDIVIGSSVQIQRLVNTDSGELVNALDGTPLFSCLLNTTTDNTALAALFGATVSAPAESLALVEDGIPNSKK